MKISKKIFSTSPLLFALFISLMWIAACSGDDNENPPVEVVLNKTVVQLQVTDRDTLQIISDIEEQAITWESSSPDVVSVDEQGRLLALQSGSAEITATVDGVSSTCSVTVDVTVFLGGSAQEFEAAYWKNGDIYYLTTIGNDEGLYSTVYGITVFEDTVYAIGQKLEQKTAVWKNGMENLLAYNASFAFDIASSDEDVYAVGSQNWVWQAMNGETLYDNSNIYAIHIDEMDNVYLGGLITNNETTRTATIWKNGAPLGLQSGQYITLHDIYASESDFFATTSTYDPETKGYTYSYWKNNDATEFGSGRYSNLPVVAKDGDVYVGGTLNQRPVVWKNGEASYYGSESESGSIIDLVFHGDDLYTIGNLGENVGGVVWKNEEEIFRTDLFDNAYLYCIDVK